MTLSLPPNVLHLQGRYTEHHMHAPYSALIECLDELCRKLLRDTAENVEKWRLKLLGIFKSQAGT